MKSPTIHSLLICFSLRAIITALCTARGSPPSLLFSVFWKLQGQLHPKNKTRVSVGANEGRDRDLSVKWLSAALTKGFSSFQGLNILKKKPICVGVKSSQTWCILDADTCFVAFASSTLHSNLKTPASLPLCYSCMLKTLMELGNCLVFFFSFYDCVLSLDKAKWFKKHRRTVCSNSNSCQWPVQLPLSLYLIICCI